MLAGLRSPNSTLITPVSHGKAEHRHGQGLSDSHALRLTTAAAGTFLLDTVMRVGLTLLSIGFHHLGAGQYRVCLAY